jgi:GTP pyrophosphokinase
MVKDLIKKAEKFAKQSHKGQKKVNGKPYFEHPKKVAELLKKWKQEDEVIVAGYLHDVVEDSEMSLNELKKKFGKRVSFLVDGMSWERDKKTRKKNWPKSYTKFANYSKRDPSLVFIKTADMISNISNIHEKSHRKWIITKSYPRAKSFWLPFLKEAGFPKESKKIESEFNKYTKKRVKSIVYDYISEKDLKKIREKLK